MLRKLHIKNYGLFLVIMLTTSFPAFAESDTSLEWVCRTHPDRVKALFEALDLGRPGLESATEAWRAGQSAKACAALLEYYRTAPGGAELRRQPPTPGTATQPGAEQMLQDTFTFQNVKGRVPRRADGGFQWAYNGPNGDLEWGWFLNRHGHIAALRGAYFSTGNPAYAKAIDQHLRDWVISSPYPGKKSNTPQWRGLEVAIRIHEWIIVFYGMDATTPLSPATRILMLSSALDHADYLRRFHAPRGNWIANEMLGLAEISVAWPEFRDAPEWLAYATTNMSREITVQVYPDGAQKELTSHYHGVTARHFDVFLDALRRGGQRPDEAIHETVERMWNYTAETMRPDGHGALNNDSNLDDNRPLIERKAAAFQRNDWLYIATNGARGEKPTDPPSRMFPWAGQLVTRSGWDAEAQWGFFDIGPYGIGHQHRDKLHLSVSAFGRDLLVDAGRYHYRREKWRAYFVGSPSHNVILIDGKQQKPYALEANVALSSETWTIAPGFDYARGTFDGGYDGLEGTASHTRALLYVRGKAWIVVDQIETDRPRDIEVLWHFHPDCTAALDGLSALTTDPDKGNLRITPSQAPKWNVRIVKGQEQPEIQGWYSREYNLKQAAQVAVYRAHIEGPATFAWALLPGKGAVPPVQVRMERGADGAAEVKIQGAGTPALVATLPLEGIAAPRVKSGE